MIKNKWKQFTLIVAVIALTITAASYFKFFPFERIPYLAIPVEFNEQHIPYTQVEIEGKTCSLILDLGSVSECWLRKELLDQISKVFIENVKWMDVRGYVHETKEYLIPKMKVQTSWIKDIIIREENYMEESPDSLWNISEQPYDKNGKKLDGRIGWQFLTSFYPLFDLGNGRFYLTRGPKFLNKLLKEGYHLSSLTSVPFDIISAGCVVTLNTCLGKKRFLLDTGSSRSLIHRDQSSQLSPISIGNLQLQNIEFLLFDFGEKFEDIDGILGMDFFSKHLIYLDFKGRQALIGPS